MLKYSVKLLLYTHQADNKGHFPIYIRITINRKPAYISTGHYIDKNYWEDKNERVKKDHLLASAINPDITARKQAIVNALAGYQLKGEKVTSAQVKQFFVTGVTGSNIFEFVEGYIKEVKHKRKGGTLSNYKKHLQVLEDFHGSRALSFEQIDHDFMVKFEDYLRNRKKENGDPLGGNYIFGINKTLRSFFNAARKRKVTTNYPFSTFEMPEYVNPEKAYLTIPELDNIEKLLRETRIPTLKQTAAYFLLGCYSGLRISDWYKFSIDHHIKDGRLRLRAKKNNEWVTMKVVGRLARLIPYLKEIKLTLTEQELNRTLKDLAKICGIIKKISSHIGRHTFAVTMCADQGVSAETCAELMGITLQTCVDNYYKITDKKIDKETVGAWEGL